jgi:hypothetical protein
MSGTSLPSLTSTDKSVCATLTFAMLPISRGFIAALGGIAMTLLAWFGSWAWPGWPASIAIDLLGFADFAELPRLAKSAVVVLLIIVNVGTWAALIRATMLLLRKSAATPRS